MRVLVVSIMMALAVALAIPATGSAGIQIGVSADDNGVNSFYLAIGQHFNAPEKEVVLVRERHVPDEELPVVFFLARRAGVSPQTIVALRLDGKSWMDITLRFGLTAAIYYVELKDVSGPPYGKAYGHYKNRHRDQWGDIRLADPDIVNFVNLKFISQHYGWAPDEVVRMREKGTSFVSINGQVKKAKAEKAKSKELAQDNEKPVKNKDKGKKK